MLVKDQPSKSRRLSEYFTSNWATGSRTEYNDYLFIVVPIDIEVISNL